VKCATRLAEEVRFCAECGTRQPEAQAALVNETRTAPELTAAVSSSMTTAAGGQERTAPVGVARSLSGASASGQRMLLPRVFRLVWSPRKPWAVTTGLSGQEIGDLFTERMMRKANVLRQANNYFRRVSWGVQRNAISGDLIAECRPDGPVVVGFGKNKWHLDVSRDTVVCHIESEGAARVNAEIGPGVYTTLFGLYAYPATVYSFDVVKAIKKVDPAATVRYPWSPVRMVLVAAVLLLIIISAASSGSNNTNNTANIQPPAPAQPSQSSEGSGEGQSESTAGSGNSTEQHTPPANSKPLPAASRTIKKHLELLGNGDYSGAFALMSEAYRSANPGWTANREQGDPEIGIVGVGQPHYRGRGTAWVYVRFYARDRNESESSDTRCRLFKGTVEMIEHGGVWRYEPSGNMLSGTVVSASACHA